MTDRLGQRLGNYRHTHLLGQGSFAEVYLAEHIALRTLAAIKILHTRVSEEDVAQFQQEARLLASLRHPHIIRVLDFGLDKQMPYLVMDYASNGTLRTRHPKGNQLPVSTVVSYVKQITQALQYAHDHKIIHRDVKPENMLIGEKNEILLSDFGIALIAQSSRNQNPKDTAGTIAYMAPEQISAHPRPASDQYSLGIVAYEWLCGTPPFHGSFTEIAVKHSVTPPPSLRKQLPILSPDVEHVVLIALAKSPEERFTSVSAFARALEQASQDLLPTDQHYPLNTPPPAYPLPSSPHPIELPVTTYPKSSVPILPISPVPAKTTDKPTVSRRTVLIGAAGFAGIIAVETAVLAFVLTHPSGTATPQRSTSTATPHNQSLIYRAHFGPIVTVAWSSDGLHIASGSEDKTAQIWSANDGSEVFIFTGHSDKVEQVAWSPIDPQRIATCSADKTA